MIGGAVLFLAVVYVPDIGHGFLKDDFGWVAAASRISARPWTAFVSDFTGTFYRPIITLTFAADYALYGLHPFGYGVSNLLMLVACALLLSGVLHHLGISATAGVAAAALWRGRHACPRNSPPAPWEWAAITAFALISLRIFLWVVFIERDEIKVLSPNNLGDLSLHLTYIRYLASGVPFWPENPIATGATLTYPIGVVVSYLLLALLFFAVLGPTALVLRILRRRPIQLGFDPKATSYWTKARHRTSKERYFRQY